MRYEIHQLRVNVKSLAAEAKIIRQEIAKTRDLSVKNGLAAHKSERVKPEARLAHLALAFLRGTPYKACEPRTKSPVTPGDLFVKLRKFCFGSVQQQEVKLWLEA